MEADGRRPGKLPGISERESWKRGLYLEDFNFAWRSVKISDSEEVEEAREQLFKEVGRLKEAFLDRSENEALEYVKRETGLQNLEDAVTKLLDEKVLEVKYSGQLSEEDFKSEARNIYRQSKQYPYSEVLEKLHSVEKFSSESGESSEQRISDAEEIKDLTQKLKDFKEENVFKNEDRRKELVQTLKKYLERNLD